MRKFLSISIYLVFVSSVLMGQHLKSVKQSKNQSIFQRQRSFIQKTSPDLKSMVQKARMDSIVGNDFDTITNKWYPAVKASFEYDSIGREKLEFRFDWDEGSNKMVAYSKVEYVYDKGQLYQELCSVPDLSNKFVIAYKNVYFYDASGKNFLRKRLEYDTAWYEVSKDTFIYDINGKLSEQIYLYYNWPQKKWLNSYKTKMLYNANGSLDKVLTMDWALVAKIWDTTEIEEHLYNPNGTEKEKIVSMYDPFDMKMALQRKTSYGYDSNGNVVTDSEYDYSFNNWEESARISYTYDLQYQSYECLLPSVLDEMDISYKNKITGMSQSELVSNQWKELLKWSFYYSQSAYPQSKRDALETLSVYPNPAHDYIVIEGFCSEEPVYVQILDIQGKLIISQKYIEKEPIQINELEAGLYIITVRSKDHNLERKLIIQ